jgi:bacillopeptidase F (M6 metalloprotease family)
MHKVTNIEGVVITVSAVGPAGKGFFNQFVTIHVPEEDYKGHKVKEEFYVIHIISNKETDSRFVKQDAKGQIRKCDVYLKGERWQGVRGDYNYTHKLNLIEWRP